EASSLRSVSSDDASGVARDQCCNDNNSNSNSKGTISHNGSRIQLFQMIILPFIPILALIIQTSFMLNDILIYRMECSEIETQVSVATDLGKLVTRLQLERSEVAFFIFTNGSTLRSNLPQRFAVTDSVINKMQTKELTVPIKTMENGMIIMLNRTEFQSRLKNFRQKISSEESSITEVMDWYTAINGGLLDHLSKQIKETDNSGVWRHLVGFKNLLRSIECYGIASVHGINYFGRGTLGHETYVAYIRNDILGRDLLNGSLYYVPALKILYKNLTKVMPDYGNLRNWSNIILKNTKINSSVENAINYFDVMSTYLDELRKIQRELRHQIRNDVIAKIRRASNSEAVGISILVVVLLVSPVIIFLVRNAANTIQMYADNLSIKAKELKREKKKSDTLLFQMLPLSVATQLKQTRKVPAEFYDDVTIYFSDIVGFTEIAADCTPLEVVTFLNSIYKVFDSRIECYDVYKVETIGDSYMVASGLPIKNGNICAAENRKKHVSEIATMALDLLDATNLFKIPRRPSETLQIRCGIHCGSCVAGIVGTKMPRYCLFGDTVNTASRMETTGEALRIHITSEMNDALAAIGGFKTEHRGLIDVKGKGLMNTYWLTCRDGAPMPVHEEIAWFADIQPVFFRY
ncbi:Atrial natriuretic peptide receptor 1, partial [Pseudolycoriella hygida]